MQENFVDVNAEFLWEGIARVGDKSSRLSDEEKKSRERKEKAREQRDQRKKRHDLIRGASGASLGANSESKHSESQPNIVEFGIPIKSNQTEHSELKERFPEGKRPDIGFPQSPEGQDHPPQQLEVPNAHEVVSVQQETMQQQQLEQDIVRLRMQLESMQAHEEAWQMQLAKVREREEALELEAKAKIEAAQAEFQSALQEHMAMSSSKVEAMMEDMQNIISQQRDELWSMKMEQEKQKLREADELAERQAREARQHEEQKFEEEEQHQQRKANGQQQHAEEETSKTKDKEKWHESFNESIKYAKMNALKQGFVCLTATARGVETLNGIVGQPLALDHFGDRIDASLKRGDFTASIEGFVENPVIMNILTKPEFGVAVTFFEQMTKTHIENVKELNRDGVYGYRRDAKKRDEATRAAATGRGGDGEQSPQKSESASCQSPQNKAQQQPESCPPASCSSPMPDVPPQPKTNNNANCQNMTSWGKRTLEKQEKMSEMKRPKEPEQKPYEIDSDDDILYGDNNDDNNDFAYMGCDGPPMYVRDPITGVVRKSAVCPMQRPNEGERELLQGFDLDSRFPKGLVGALDLAVKTMGSKPLEAPKMPDFSQF